MGQLRYAGLLRLSAFTWGGSFALFAMLMSVSNLAGLLSYYPEQC